MCKYCKEEAIILQEDEIVSNVSFGFGDYKVDRSECTEYSLSVFIDRGHLRLVDIEDSGCLDHGDRIEIKYCPFCGESID